MGFTIIGSDLAQGGGWAECTLKTPIYSRHPAAPEGWEQRLSHLD